MPKKEKKKEKRDIKKEIVALKQQLNITDLMIGRLEVQAVGLGRSLKSEAKESAPQNIV